jgi:ferredoxin
VNINKATAVYFSPTGTTKKILEGFIEGFHVAMVKQIDLTLPAVKNQDFIIEKDGFAIIGAPVYGGRIPVTATQRLKRLKADKTPAVILVVYGNRAFEDALLELSVLVKEVGFIPVAAAAFIGEHSYSTEKTPIAAGRPDAQDLMQARDFGSLIRKKMGEMQTLDATAALSLPGNFPYKDNSVRPAISPIILQDLCNLCGDCAAVCPTAAIKVDSTVLIDKKRCIQCCACVKNCPVEACVMEELLIKQRAQRLSETCQERKAPDLFA